ncbi:MAG: DUF1361 domain-containing protein [Acaryochloridaceae cyanobacterium SU_2_1]|nr:DUF1361 domain-containing protein [Acaryochloridaceae cyanobacterium SU_2_1]
MEDILGDALGEYNGYSGWIIWNLFLAFIPLALSFMLFRCRWQRRSLLWWLGLISFIAFLPNAPYLLTDIIHLIEAARNTRSIWVVTLIFIPLHTFAIVTGFEAYVIALINQGHYLKQQGAGRFIFWSELLAHILCAIGIYLGRFIRLNSWDLVTDFHSVLRVTVNELSSRFPVIVIFITLMVLMIGYWLTKQLTLGVVLRIKEVRHHQHKSISNI